MAKANESRKHFHFGFFDGEHMQMFEDHPQAEQSYDAVIAEARHPNPYDRVLEIYGEAATGLLPSEDELDARQIDRRTLAYMLRKGIKPGDLTRVIRRIDPRLDRAVSDARRVIILEERLIEEVEIYLDELKTRAAINRSLALYNEEV
ncbi:MAG: hypothetical protein K2X27_13975 [Candidatus Obscuribacterales bacterium]|nr:hypothetical protein [Candidatus Obscuribacterales bacterium]